MVRREGADPVPGDGPREDVGSISRPLFDFRERQRAYVYTCSTVPRCQAWAETIQTTNMPDLPGHSGATISPQLPVEQANLRVRRPRARKAAFPVQVQGIAKVRSRRMPQCLAPIEPNRQEKLLAMSDVQVFLPAGAPPLGLDAKQQMGPSRPDRVDPVDEHLLPGFHGRSTPQSLG